ncbi:MAG: hypothetical protein E4H44_00215 [Candidatus Aminicenantes bacterium]|nr:MAG: hypothetical protein E4H44_00215 [Candidatus Aminicenantes bacterium]
MTLHGGPDLLSLHPARFCNAIYAWYVERVEDREKFDFALNKPIPGRPARESDVASEMQAFAQVAAMMGGKAG